MQVPGEKLCISYNEGHGKVCSLLQKPRLQDMLKKYDFVILDLLDKSVLNSTEYILNPIFFKDTSGFLKCIKYTKWNVFIRNDDVINIWYLYFCITVKKTTNMAVIEVQFGLPPETNKKRILTWLQKRNSFSSRRFWNVRVPCLNRFRDWKGGIVKPKESIWKAIAATLNVDFKTKVRNYKPCKIARSFPCEF